MSKIHDLLQEEISRKDFIRYIGLALLGMIGVTSFLQSLANNFGKSETKQVESKSAGYGMTPYGR